MAETADWTEQKDPTTNAQTLGSMVKIGLQRAAAYEEALKRIAASLNNGAPAEIERARLVANNTLAGDGPLDDFKALWYECIPRRGGEPTSYG